MNFRLKFSLFVFILSVSTQAQQIKVSFSTKAYEGAFSGKVLLYLSKDGKSPKDLGIGLPTLSCFAIDVNNINPNGTVVFDDTAISYAVKLSNIERGEYYVQAVWDRNLGGRNIGNSPENLYSKPIKINLTRNTKATYSIQCDQIIPKPTFKETEFTKEIKVPSALLSVFYKRDITIDAAVILPKEYYKEPTRKFPVHFIIFGFGGDYHEYSGKEEASIPLENAPCITVILDGNCPTGHSTYANSDNNGSWSDALVKEFIPMVEKKYRCNSARLLSGHSSGGWSVLWLQINYPETFAGCWSSAPDPVDFRNFQQIDLYTNKNMFYDKEGNLRLDAAVGGYIPWLYLRDDYRIEDVLYRGEQYASWNAVFGKKTKDGAPEKICNTKTGEIDSNVVAHWKAYDISLLIRTNWQQLKTELNGKIRISTGNQDNYFLNQAVELLEVETKKLNADFVYDYYPGDHFTVHTPEYDTAGYAFLANKYAAWVSKKTALGN
ncbi:alpha/beta hydrolase-fold protein [Flavobacterium sp.]|uniref:alpha/beta hydrolase-fold protein n=1 Tax=Flavobacterium sp. TaxID=239 RepID=UPI00286D25DF|nr:alpha/beta hydrolase-fold protein [Flavobacterium sp.]